MDQIVARCRLNNFHVTFVSWGEFQRMIMKESTKENSTKPPLLSVSVNVQAGSTAEACKNNFVALN